jgi:hypothetical protein
MTATNSTARIRTRAQGKKVSHLFIFASSPKSTIAGFAHAIYRSFLNAFSAGASPWRRDFEKLIRALHRDRTPALGKFVHFSVSIQIRLLQPWHANIGKRLVKRPKVYFRDSGLFHALLAIRTERDLVSHNKLAASWEGFALEAGARALGKRNEELAFWATHSGAEVDLFWRE